MSRLLGLLLPERLGADVRWLFGGLAVANLADGVLLAAAPLLVASVTRDPLAVSLTLFAQRLPWVLFSLPVGAHVDRTDRRRLVVVVDVLRAALLAGLTVTVLLGALSLPVLYAALFVLGTAETFGDNAATALLADVAPAEHMGLASSRLVGAHQVANQLAGPSLGALLFGLAAAVPLGAAAGLYATGAALLLGVARRAAPARTGRAMRSDVAEGLRWLRGNAAVRRLVVLITLYNVSFGAAYAIWVLYALERLGLGEAGYGLLLTVSALGGVVGAAAYERLEQRFGNATLLRAGLVLETLHHAGLASTRSPVVAGVVLFGFGAHGAVWGSLSRTIRLRATPARLQGRVSSVNMLGVFGTLVLGSVLGGLLARSVGVVGVLWAAFAAAALTTAWCWRSVDDIAAAGTPDPA